MSSGGVKYTACTKKDSNQTKLLGISNPVLLQSKTFSIIMRGKNSGFVGYDARE